MKINSTLSLLLMALVVIACQAPANYEANNGEIDRSILPIQAPPTQPITEMDARNATAPERFVVRAPKGAPNVVVVLIDDIGFGATSTFGGPINTPTFDRLANNGLRYNRFHTTA